MTFNEPLPATCGVGECLSAFAHNRSYCVFATADNRLAASAQGRANSQRQAKVVSMLATRDDRHTSLLITS